MATGFDIGRRHVGDGAPCFIVAEVGLAHDGSLGIAHSYIDAIAKAGADAAKFQCHLGDGVSEWRVPPTWPQDANREEYWKRTAFTLEQWWSLRAHCDEVGLEFLCSPFSVEAVRLLGPLVKAWKVPSGKIRDRAMLDEIGATGKPVIVSSGMGTLSEISDVMHFLTHRCPVALLQCTSLYPCPPEKVGLGEDIFRYWHGLSEHSGTIYAGLAAVALGASIVEVHVCFSKDQWAPDVASSITIEQLRQLVEGARFIEQAKRPVDKDQIAKELEPMRRLFMGQPEKERHARLWGDKSVMEWRSALQEHLLRRFWGQVSA